MKSVNLAVKQWQEIIGIDHVVECQTKLKEAEVATFKTEHKVQLILRPADKNEVQECLKIANQHKIHVYPISTGKNWGLGSRVPTKDSSVIIDLSRLNGILDYNEDMAYVTIEPGVTCRQLYNFLREKKSNLMVSLTGSTPDSSFIGNVMERGHSKGAYADRYSNVCGLEVILPTAECIHSGFDRFSEAKAAPVARWGVGPILEGLFSQSNLGIVTKLTIWLQPFPEVLQTVFFSVKDVERLPMLVDTLRDLRLKGAIRSSISLLNDCRVQSELGQYPWEEMKGETPLSKEVLENLKRKNTGMKCWDGIWNGETALYSMSKEHAEADRNFIKKILGPMVDKLEFHEQTKESVLKLMEYATDAATGFLQRDKLTYSECRMLGFLGIPLAGSVPITYWRKKTAMPMPLTNLDPDRDGCGIIWCSPTVPFNGHDIKAASTIIEETMNKYGFESNLCLNAVAERSIDITAAILFDRNNPGDDERAITCYNEMLNKLCTAGYVPYRLTVHSMKGLLDNRDDYAQVLKRIKDSLDPNGILAPGRYE
jgi:4-cresol dehydrogenase (hydroxylating) flavoprotein subunit